MSNRMRAIFSSRAIVEKTGHKLVILWDRDVQCNASFFDLFSALEGEIVRETRKEDLERSDWLLSPRDPIRIRPKTNVYVSTPFLVEAKGVSSNVKKQYLMLPFSKRVKNILRKLVVENGERVGAGVHIRSLCDQRKDSPGLSLHMELKFQDAVPYRSLCNWTSFLTLLRSGVLPSGSRVAILADTIEAKMKLALAMEEEGFHAIAMHDPPNCHDEDRRKTLCLQHALANMLFVANHSQNLFLSEWSSYSEAIHWMSSLSPSVVWNGCIPKEDQTSQPSLVTRNMKGSVSVVVACRNRKTWRHVLKSISSLERKYPSDLEVVLVDWSSNEWRPRISETTNINVKLIRVSDIPEWNLAQAYNLAISRARGEYVLKIDCDTSSICIPFLPPPMTFMTGNWSVGGHINGILFARRQDILSVGGYDERLDRYGWDDTDLYYRLSTVALLRQTDDLTDGRGRVCMVHMSHGNGQRMNISSHIQAQILTQKNRLCVMKNRWNASFARTMYRHNFYQPHSLRRVWYPLPISADTRSSCKDRVAVGAVLDKLIKGCTKKLCEQRFWKLVTTGAWSTPEDLLLLVFPRKKNVVARCISQWPDFEDPGSVASCRQLIT
jgi:hypothetical protein